MFVKGEARLTLEGGETQETGLVVWATPENVSQEMRSGAKNGSKINKLWVTAAPLTQTLATVIYIQVSKQSLCVHG